MRRAALITIVAVLGAGCTGDRPASAPEPRPTPDTRPVCRASPGPPPEGFLLTRTKEIRYRDRVGTREEYRDERGRLLVYLLGVTGEMGEGAAVADDVELATGQPATLFGNPEHGAWSLVWTGEHPCPQLAVVGNGFSRAEFEQALRDATILP